MVFGIIWQFVLRVLYLAAQIRKPFREDILINIIAKANDDAGYVIAAAADMLAFP